MAPEHTGLVVFTINFVTLQKKALKAAYFFLYINKDLISTYCFVISQAVTDTNASA